MHGLRPAQWHGAHCRRLIVYPRHLCVDWTAGSIPLLTDVADVRVAAIVGLYLVLGGDACVPCSGDGRRRGCGRVWAAAAGGTERRATADLHWCVCLVAAARPIVDAAVALSAATFLPSSNLFFYVGFTLAERVLYMPSMGFIIAGVVVLAKLGGVGWMLCRSHGMQSGGGRAR